MRTKPIIAGAVVAVLLSTAIVLISARPSPPPITVRHVKSVQSGGGIEITYELTNHTTNSYSVYPVSVEVRNGLVWKTCSDFNSHPRPIHNLGPLGSESSTFEMTNLPTGSPLRLSLCAGKELTGLERFFRRLGLRFRHGNKDVPLNPFDKTIVFSKPTQIVSDEFVEPEPNHLGQRNSEK